MVSAVSPEVIDILVPPLTALPPVPPVTLITSLVISIPVPALRVPCFALKAVDNSVAPLVSPLV